MLFTRNKMMLFFALAVLTIWPVMEIRASVNSEKDVFLSSVSSLVRLIIKDNPEIQSSLSVLKAASDRMSGTRLPIFNPEIELESERIKENDDPVFTSRVGISQTIDWHGKRDAKVRVAEMEQRFLHEGHLVKKHRLIGEILSILIRYKTSQQIDLLIQNKTDLLTDFVRLMEQKRQAGDIGETDISLARIALNEAVMEQSSRKAVLIELDGMYQKLGGHLPIDIPVLPDNFQPLEKNATDLTTMAEKHPSVRAARMNVDGFEARVAAADNTRKADPTIKITIGQQHKKEDDETIIAMGLSMPLPVRNDFSSEVNAARQEKIQSEQDAQNTLQQIMGDMNASLKKYQLLNGTWQEWKKNGRINLDKHLQILDRLWKSGEMSTLDYLIQLKQGLDTKVAGLEMYGRTWEAWVAWLIASGQTEDWLFSATEQMEQK